MAVMTSTRVYLHPTLQGLAECMVKQRPITVKDFVEDVQYTGLLRGIRAVGYYLPGEEPNIFELSLLTATGLVGGITVELGDIPWDNEVDL